MRFCVAPLLIALLCAIAPVARCQPKPAERGNFIIPLEIKNEKPKMIDPRLALGDADKVKNVKMVKITTKSVMTKFGGGPKEITGTQTFALGKARGESASGQVAIIN